MNPEYIKFLQAYSDGSVVTEKQFDKIIKLFPNTEINWEEVIGNVSYHYYEDYSDPDYIIKSIILSLIDTVSLFIYDYYNQDNSISLEVTGNLSKKELSEELNKLESLGFIINDKEELFEDLEEKKEYINKTNYLTDLQIKINRLSLEQLQKLEKVIDNGLN